MKVILTKDVPDVGRAGTVLNVAPGYARNYLYPRSLAVAATESNLRQLALKRKRAEELAAIEKAEAARASEALAKVELRFTLKAGEGGVLFGSVSQADIAQQLSERGYHIDRRKVLLREHIKRTGLHHVDIRLHGEVTGRVRVLVEAETPSQPKQHEPAAAQAPAGEEAPVPSAETPAEER